MVWIDRHFLALAPLLPEFGGLVPLRMNDGAHVRRHLQAQTLDGHDAIFKLLAAFGGGRFSARRKMPDVHRRLHLVAMLSARARGAAEADLALFEQVFFGNGGGMRVHGNDS